MARGRTLVRALAVAIAALASVPFGANASGQREPATVEGLRVLIVNDDSVQGQSPRGSDGRGLYELRKAMCAAGADVLVVGPWAVQSGMGGRITLSGPLTVQQVTPPPAYAADCATAPTGGVVFGLCAAAAPCTASSPSGSPADSVRVALQRFVPENYWPDGPDIVLSGINFGQNEGLGVLHSGTTSAAVTAHNHGAPAIAFSEELVLSCLTATADCPEYTVAADFAVRFVAELRRAGLITPELLLNVNHPHIGPGEQLQPPVLNVLGFGSNLNFVPTGEVPATGGTYTVLPGPPEPETRRDADTTAILENHISIVPLTSDWTARAPGRLRQIVHRLG